MGNRCSGSWDAAIPVQSGTSHHYKAATPSTNVTSSSLVASSLDSFGVPTPSRDLSRHASVNHASLKAFSYNDLKAATRNFRPDSIVGEGGFGVVYKGYVDEQTLVPSRPGQGMVVAIKKLKLGGMQGHREWLTEVHYLGSIQHENLVTLIGCCAEDSDRLLVYEYMPRGSLENHLFHKGGHGSGMPWPTRIKVAVGAARGLAFLHGLGRQVIYRDFKASNILLDNEFNAKLSDFGLAKYGPMGDDTHVSTRIMGTYGYAAPEYLSTGHLSARSDVYSFGVVLLELLTGLKAVDNNRPHDEEKLVEWAKPFLGNRRQVMRIMDERLQGQVSSRLAYKVAQLAGQCVHDAPKARPTMQEIVQSLDAALLQTREEPR